MQANEHDIQKRMLELEKSLGTLLPQTPSAQRIEEIVREAGVEEVKESAAESSAPFTRNPCIGNADLGPSLSTNALV